jgi:hypothetical protein
MSVWTLPLFPLPNVVLFPGVLLPLHIFEPRYRAMVADALDDDRRLGMVLLQSGWEADYEGRPTVFPIGCSGVIVHAIQLDDGRYNIVLRGLERFRIVGEDHARAYRRAVIDAMPDPPLGDSERNEVSDLRSRLVALLGPSYLPAVSSMRDEDFVHALAQNLDLEPFERQALLERDNLCLRARSLVELLEMKRLLSGMPAGPTVLQ